MKKTKSKIIPEKGDIQVPEGVEVKQKIPKALLEILIYGDRKDMDKIDPILKSLQNELNESRRAKKARVLWYVDNGEKPIEEKKQWLMENMNCKYYVYADCENYTINKDLIKNVLFNIKKTEEGIKGLKLNNVERALKKEPEKNNGIEDAQIVE
jgi:hypothetical protein